MKKLLTLAVTMAIAVSAAALPYSQARTEALFLSDKMAYELGLSPEQYAAVYEINFDYFYCVNSRNAIYGIYWQRRNMDLQYVLTPFQYECYQVASYFYRPLTWYRGSWRFVIRNRYTVGTRIYMGYPVSYRNYRGGHNKPRNSYYHGRSFNQPAAPNPQNPYPGKNKPSNGTRNHGQTSFDHNNNSQNNQTRPNGNNPPRPNGNNNQTRPNSNNNQPRPTGNMGRPTNGSNGSSSRPSHSSRPSGSSNSNRAQHK